MSGAAIGTKPTIMPSHLIEIRKGRKKAREERFARRFLSTPNQDFTMLGTF